MAKRLKKADAILAADLHLRDSQPICRTDNFTTTQMDKLLQIQHLKKEHGDIPVFCAGDVFDKWKPSPFLLSTAFDYLPDDMVCIPGNHDLPAHNIDQIHRSGIYTLWMGNKIELLHEGPAPLLKDGFLVFGFPYGAELQSVNDKKDKRIKVALVHYFTYKGRRPFPGSYLGVQSLMNKLKGYDLIVCGDNHKPFIHSKGKQLLVNPGSIFRQTADQYNHKPRVYLYYKDIHAVEPYYLKIKKSAVDRSYLDIAKERNTRIEAFVQRLKGDFDMSVNFERNLKRFVEANDISKHIRRKIREAVDGDE